MAASTNEFAEDGVRRSAFTTQGARPLDDLCELASRLFDLRAACLLLKQHGMSRMVASHGLPVKMRSIGWDFSNAPYGPEERYILADATDSSFAQSLFHEFGLRPAGGLLRAPVVNEEGYSLSLMLLGDKPIAMPTAKKLALLDEIIALARVEFKTVEDLLTDPTSDVTVARTLAEVEAMVAECPMAAFLLNDQLRIVAANEGASAITTISGSELIGLGHADIAGQTADAVNFLYRRALETLESPPDFEVIISQDRENAKVYRLSVSPFSPVDTRDYFLFVMVEEATRITSRLANLANAIDEDHGVEPPKDPSQLFLLDTLVKRRAIRQRKTTNYLALRSWRQSIRDYQIKALKALKQNIPPELPKAIAKEVAEEVDALFGRSGFKAIVPMPCGHSRGSHCLSLEIARALGVEMGLPVVQAFLHQPTKGSSHPKKNTRRPPLALARVISEPVLLVDDVATSGAHIEEAVKLLKPTCGAVMSVAWIGGDVSDKDED